MAAAVKSKTRRRIFMAPPGMFKKEVNDIRIMISLGPASVKDKT
jgi:hypothetical protein